MSLASDHHGYQPTPAQQRCHRSSAWSHAVQSLNHCASMNSWVCWLGSWKCCTIWTIPNSGGWEETRIRDFLCMKQFQWSFRVLPGSTLALCGRFRPKYLVKCVSNDIISPQSSFLHNRLILTWCHGSWFGKELYILAILVTFPSQNIAPCSGRINVQSSLKEALPSLKRSLPKWEV